MHALSAPNDAPDTSETVFVKPLALIKMARHARLGIPMEVMGLLLGKFVDEYKVSVLDVFWMPQHATGITVDSVDAAFQLETVQMLEATGRDEKVVGWYHSHPGFGCWLSSTDVNTAQAFERDNERAVSIVIDPVQSVKGKVVIEAFRTTGPHSSMWSGVEIRQTTSNECIRSTKGGGYSSLISSPGRSYYTLNLCIDISPEEKKILRCMDRPEWTRWMTIPNEQEHFKENLGALDELKKLTTLYKKIAESEALNDDEIGKDQVGKVDPRKSIEDKVGELIQRNFSHSVITLFNRMAIS